MVGNCTEPLVITELFVSGTFDYDQVNENRIKEWLVECPTGETIFPANIVGANPLWAVGATWQGHDGVDSDSTSVPPDGFSSKLKVQSVRAKQLAPQAIRVTAFYSTKGDLWRIKKRIEVTTESEELSFDLDARDNFNCPDVPFPPIFPVENCISWCDISEDKRTSNPSFQNIPRQAVPVSKYNAIYSGLFVLTQANLFGLADITNSINLDPFMPGVTDEQLWMIKGITGEQVRELGEGDLSNLWRMEFRFQYDKRGHRKVGIMNEQGTWLDATVYGSDFKTVCRAYRTNEILSWSGPNGLPFVP